MVHTLWSSEAMYSDECHSCYLFLFIYWKVQDPYILGGGHLAFSVNIVEKPLLYKAINYPSPTINTSTE